MNKELIDKLKDPKQAQPFGLRSKAEQELLTKAGRPNCRWYDEDGWNVQKCDSYCKETTYILKPDYEPEPEYEDIEIEGSLWLMVKSDPYNTTLRTMVDLTGHRNFVKFYADICKRISLEDVAGAYRTAQERGHKVYARFVNEG